MVDVLTPEQRRYNMSRIRSRNTKPELIVRRMLFAMGYRYRLHVRDLPGTPDIVFPGRRKVIFVHGCFWHGHEGCRFATEPATNAAFWKAKIQAAKSRDVAAFARLVELGWFALVIWECEEKDVGLQIHLRAFLGNDGGTDPVPDVAT